MIVMKFGGSSIASAEKVRAIVGLIQAETDRTPGVVVSAHGKTTNGLIAAANEALIGRVDVAPIASYHRELVAQLGLSDKLVEPLLNELHSFLHGVSLIRELTLRTLDQIMSFGERLSTRIVAAALTAAGCPAQAVNAYEIGLVTDARHGSAAPLPGIEKDIAAGIAAVEGVAVVTGFLGRTVDGETTTLGRSGSDYSAAILGAALAADEVQIWTDVSGIMTCDPSVDASARSLPQLSFDEASELAYYGAEVLHPATLVPAIRAGIPVRVLNTMRPEDPGTLVLPGSTTTDRFAKSIVYKEDVNLITIASHRLMSAVQILSRAFEVLSLHEIGVHMATTSEATVSLVTDRDYTGPKLAAALEALAELGTSTAEPGKAIICVIGEELRGAADALGRIFGRLSDSGVKAKMVSQSASEINIAFLVDNSEIEASVKALHSLMGE